MEHVANSSDNTPSASHLSADNRRDRRAIACHVVDLQNIRSHSLFNLHSHGINVFLSYPTVFARAWVCSAVFPSAHCHVEFPLNIPSVPVSCSPSFFLSVIHIGFSLLAGELTISSPNTHTHTQTACLLSDCINIYLSSCPSQSPVNTFL